MRLEVLKTFQGINMDKGTRLSYKLNEHDTTNNYYEPYRRLVSEPAIDLNSILYSRFIDDWNNLLRAEGDEVIRFVRTPAPRHRHANFLVKMPER